MTAADGAGESWLASAAVTDALYVPDGDQFVSTSLTRGPWSPHSQHGGPPSALLIRAAEQLAGDHTMTARATIEILRPIPVSNLEVKAEAIRPGHKVQLIGATLIADGSEIARLTSLHLRRNDEFETPPALHDVAPPPPPTEGTNVDAFHLGYESFVNDALEVRYLGRPANETGPSKGWTRLRVPLVAGEDPSPTQRVAVAADCGNGISFEIPFDSHLFVNPDLTIYLHRPPVGEWVLIDSVTDLGPGVGLAQSALFDVDGPIGRSLQALYVDRRDT
jgi:hypothetical protein